MALPMIPRSLSVASLMLIATICGSVAGEQSMPALTILGGLDIDVSRSIFDEGGMGRNVRDVALHFGVPSFEYLVWAITNNFQDVLLDISDRTNLTERHFDYLVNTTLEAEIEAACEASSVPLATIKQGVVGVLIAESTNSIHKRAARTLEEILGQVVEKIIQLDKTVDVEELNRKVSEALDLLRGEE